MRALFHKRSVKQLHHGLLESKFKPTSKISHILEKMYSGVIGTMVLEESIGAAKNAKRSKACRKFRRPETSAQQLFCIVLFVLYLP